MGSISEAPDVLSVVEAGHILGIGREAAYQGVRTGEIPAVRVGRRWLVPKVALLRRFAEAGRVQS